MYKFLGFHFRKWLLLFWPIKFLLRVKIFPKSFTEDILKEKVENKNVIYIIPRMSILDIFVLNVALKKLKQRPLKNEATSKNSWTSSVLALKAPMFFTHDDKELFIKNILQLLQSEAHNTDKQFVFFPVAIYWSRSAERNEKGFLLKSLFPDDGSANFLQKFFMLLLHRGEVSVSFGKEIEAYLPDSSSSEVSLEDVKATESLDLTYAKRLRRQLYIEFAKERTSFVGPALYELDKTTQWILESDQTKAFLMNNEHPERTTRQIKKYIREIAANYRYGALIAVEQLFDFVWNKVFTGIRVRNFEKVERLVRENCVIWMPSHRSHFDYLLLNYLLFKQGLIVPHVAAGSNLNFWPIGAFIRSGGGFFIRRSFSGNKTYTHAFSQYVNFLLHNSYPIEFFPEGGRSRIGKLLPPKLGMLSICVQSIIHRKSESTFLMPVSTGYDKVMEDNTYAKELKGAKKQKENVLQFLNGVRKVFANYGSVDVSFGEPVLIGDAWSIYTRKLKSETGRHLLPQEFKDLPSDIDTRDPQIQAFIKFLSNRVHQKINSAATASSTSLLSTVLITERVDRIPKHSLALLMLVLHFTVNELGEQLKWSIATSKTADNIFEYLQSHLVSENNPDPAIVSLDNDDHDDEITKLSYEYLQMGKTWRLLSEEKENGTQFCVKNTEKEFNLWWYRGTVYHIFAIVGVIAQNLTTSHTKSLANLRFTFDIIRKIWSKELFWDEDTASEELIESGLHILKKLNVLSFDGQTIDLNIENNLKQESVLSPKGLLNFYAHTVRPEVELYGLLLSVSLFLIHKKRSFGRAELLEKALSVHESAYKQNLTTHPSTFTKVFGNSIFDALSAQHIFIMTERHKFKVDMLMITSISEFFELKKWKSFLKY